MPVGWYVLDLLWLLANVQQHAESSKMDAYKI